MVLKKITGIYKITNLINQKFYIGCSNNIAKRWKDHIKGSHSIYLCNAIKKYGANNFKFEILEKTTKEEKYNREKYWIEKLKPAYNLIQSVEGVYKHSDETLKKLSKAMKGKYDGENHHNYGKKLSKETRKKISEAQKGEKGNNWKGGITKDWKAYRNAYMKAYYQTPKRKAYMNAYYRTPKYKAYKKARYLRLKRYNTYHPKQKQFNF